MLGGIAKRPIASVTPHELLDVLKRVERRGHHETAIRLRAVAGRVFRYGFATLRTERNPADILPGALTVPRVKHHAAIVDPKKVGELLRTIEDYNGRPETLYALRLAPHVFLRPGELRQAKWSEIDFAEKVWRVPAERMKMKQAHAVPLSRQVLFILQDLRSLARSSEFLFPALHTTVRPISENTMNVALRRLGFEHDEMTSHGFRAMASILLNESGLWHPDAIERALAHGEKDRVRAAYHRGAHWNERVRMPTYQRCAAARRSTGGPMPDKPVIRVKDLKHYLEKFGDQAVVVRSKADQTHEGAYLVLDIAIDHLEQEHEGRA